MYRKLNCIEGAERITVDERGGCVEHEIGDDLD